MGEYHYWSYWEDQFRSTADSPDPRIDLKVPTQDQYDAAVIDQREAKNAHQRLENQSRPPT